ncbi:MAG: homocysteine S-methyltransferase family protein [Mucispirillum sp.]|nr:homocysteine S-methyltransferase family protein [Mucispirillum sp.]
MSLREFAKNNMVIFDGAMGTSIQKVNISDEKWQGKNGCNEFLCIAYPEVIYDIHKGYFESGANVAVTNTFGAIASVLAEYGLEDKVVEINRAAVEIARKAAEGRENTFISLSMGPGTKLASLGHTSYQSLYEQYLQQAECVDVDLYNIETAQDILQLKAAVNACKEANRRKNTDTPILVSFTVENTYTLLTGSDISAVAAVMAGMPVFALGLNCAMGPDMLEPAIASLSNIWGGNIYISPNAGMPETVDGKTVYPMNDEKFTAIMKDLLDKYPISLAGGCCGTDKSHIKMLSDMAKNRKVPERAEKAYYGEAASLFTAVSLEQNPKPAMIGERANATGSKAFREMLLADDVDGMTAICKNQEESAHFIDLSLAYAGRKEIDDYKKMVPVLNSALMAPLVIDSTDPETVKASLERYSGKPIINSINFEDGGTKLHKMLAIVKEHPACMVALTIDEDGMAATAEKKFQIAKRLYDTWVHEYNFKPEDLIIDTLTFSIGSGDETLTNAAIETLEAIKMIKKNLKGVKTTLGVSNVSFGLSPASRQILNSVFLNEAVKAGLDTAIVHASKLTPIANLSEDDVKCCLDLIYARDNALPKFIEHFANVKIDKEEIDNNLPPIELLPLKIIKGDKTDLENIIASLLESNKAEDIINNILFPAMQQVGDMFGEGKMLLPFVLKSAETMKAAVSILEPHLEKQAGASKGEVVIATVAGDVHDIGKNLVDIIMSNNGFHVHNLGIKVPVSQMIQKAKEVGASAIGMSGLLVKSTLIMKENLEEIVKELPDIKIMLGGAALTNKFVNESCAPIMPDKVFYCKDAFDNISAMDGTKKAAEHKVIEKQVIEVIGDEFEVKKEERADILKLDKKDIPAAPFYGTKVISADIFDVYKYLNKPFLFSNIWGYKKKDLSCEDYELLINDTVVPELKTLFKDITNKKACEPKMIYGYFKCRSINNSIEVYAADNALLHTFNFPDSKTTPKYSLADFISSSEEFCDVLPMQIVTLGEKPAQYCADLFKNNDYKNYYMAHGLFTELTEALAEYTHRIIRKELGILDKNNDTPENAVAGKYRSKRFSFGYPLCPDIENNNIIANMLQSERIGVTLSQSNQMHPEYSTSAFIIHHPNIKY